MNDIIKAMEERRSIRKFYALTFLAVLFGYLTALTVFTLIQVIATAVLQQIDMRALDGTLPQNYNAILQQFMEDSSIMYAANLIAFLLGNLFGFLVGCKLTDLKLRDFFQLVGIVVVLDIIGEKVVGRIPSFR